MSPDDLDRYTADIGELLKDASYKKIPVSEGSLTPYQPFEVKGEAMGPMTFIWAWAWTPQAEKQRQAWESLHMGFKMALGVIYPDCPLINLSFNVPDSRMAPLGLFQMYAKARRSVRGPIVFIEPDVVCNKRCEPFDAFFDIGLPDCADHWPMMPFNPGVMFVRDTPGAQRFLDAVMEYACYFPQNSDPWYLGQLALSHAYLVLKDQIKITVFPHEEYNYSPTVYAPTDAYFVHLKGDRKKMQRDYVLPITEGRQGRLIVPAEHGGIGRG
jgi:hypothetical protein